MKKRALQILIFLMIALPFAGTARADSDFLQKALSMIRNKLNDVVLLKKEVTLKQAELNTLRQSAGKPLDFLSNLDRLNRKYGDRASKVIKKPDFIDMDDPAASAENIGARTMPEYGHGNDTAIFRQKDEEIQVMQRDNISNLYAIAYIMRFDLLNEEEEDDIEMDQEDKIIQATTEKALSITKRLARISTLEMMIMEFKTSQQLKTFKIFDLPSDMSSEEVD
jgi:hypothetical protein